MKIVVLLCSSVLLLPVEAKTRTSVPIYGMVQTREGIEILVESNGCTDLGSFEIATAVAESAPPQMIIDFNRVRDDVCKREKFLKSVLFPWKTLKIDLTKRSLGAITITNKLLIAPSGLNRD